MRGNKGAAPLNAEHLLNKYVVDTRHQRCLGNKGNCPLTIRVADATAIMNAATASAAQPALGEAFTVGMRYGYWLALVTAVPGIMIIAAIDENMLRADSDRPRHNH